MVYYLKANVNNIYTRRNLVNWINILVAEKSAKIYLLCDNQDLLNSLNIQFPNVSNCIEIIGSERNDPILKELVENTLSEVWYSAGYAHLTTFLHATRNGYDAFWNIDADDTHLAVNDEDTRVIMKRVQEIAEADHIHAFSYDMHVSRSGGAYWTFGITYTDNRINWFDKMYSYIKEYQDMRQSLEPVANLDWFFTYLKNKSYVKLESFYVDNIYFAHFSGDLINRVPGDGFYCWEQGRYTSKTLKDLFELEEGEMEIEKNLIKIDIGSDREDSFVKLREYFGVEPSGGITNLEKVKIEGVAHFLDGEKLCGQETVSCVDLLNYRDLNDRSIVLMPYSSTSKPLPAFFWELLAEALAKFGYSVFTYTSGKRIPVKGTKCVPDMGRFEVDTICLWDKGCENNLSDDKKHFIIHTGTKTGDTEKYEKTETNGIINLSCDSYSDITDVARSILTEIK